MFCAHCAVLCCDPNEHLQYVFNMCQYCQHAGGIVFVTCTKDLQMFDEVTDTPTVARTSNLNEELGQVGHLQCIG